MSPEELKTRLYDPKEEFDVLIGIILDAFAGWIDVGTLGSIQRFWNRIEPSPDQEQKANVCDEFLAELDPKRMKPEACMGVLRSSTSRASALPNWKTFRDRTMEAHNPNGERDGLFCGLTAKDDQYFTR